MLSSWLEIVLRASAIYVVVLVGLRLLGKSHIGQLSIFDFVLILLISNAVQNAMVGNDSSLLGGIIAAATLLALNYLITWLRVRFQSVDRVFEGSPSLLIHNGLVVVENLHRERITIDELERSIREHGIQDSSEVKIAIMESDGAISVIPKSGPETHIETFRHKRTKYHQRKDL
jgi:uncharacterized membrane protein YcaP (DUF421 family)